jgi:hypothetical protein
MSDKPTKRSYSLEETELGLTALALQNGNTRAASRDLAEQGCEVPRETLRYWRNHLHIERYEQIAQQLAPKIEERIVSRLRENIEAKLEASRLATDLERQRIEAGDVKDASAVVRNMDTGIGIGVTKILELTGRPTAVIEHRNTDELLNKLERMGVAIDSTAEEITEDVPSLPAVSS